MAFVDDIASDYTIWDAGESVTLRQIRGDGVTSVTVDNVVSNPLSRQQFQSSAVPLLGDERQFSLNTTQVGSLEVVPGDVLIRANGDLWDILSVQHLTADTRWLVTARKQQEGA